MTAPSEWPRRVLLASHYFPPHLGGVENVVRHEALGLARHGVEVTVLTSGETSGTRMVADGVRVVRVAAWNGLERRGGVPFPVVSPRLLATALALARWSDIAHVHDVLYMTSWAAGLAATLARRRYVLTQHVGVVEHPSRLVRAAQRGVYALPGRRLLRGAERVLVVNATVANLAMASGARAGAVRHFANGVDAALFRPAASAAERAGPRDRFGLPQDRTLVLFVGRFVPKKGYDLLVAAADPGYELVFVGEGPCRVADGRPGVRHVPPLGPADLAALYRACDIFALPSAAEGFPLTVQEAMASGLPVVTTDDPGYEPYHLDRGQVALVPREVNAVREALSSLAADADRRLRMGRWSRRYAERTFAWEEHVAGLLRLYADLAPGGAPGRPAGTAGRGGARRGSRR